MLTIEKKNDGELIFSGRFDASQAEMAKEALSGIQNSVTIDVSELEYISSMGLSVLVGAYKKVRGNGGTIRLTGMQPHIRDIFMYTSLDQLFEIK